MDLRLRAVGYLEPIVREHVAEQLDCRIPFAQKLGLSSKILGVCTPGPKRQISLVNTRLMNCQGGRRRQSDLDYAKAFASSKVATSNLQIVRRKSLLIRRVRSSPPLPKPNKNGPFMSQRSWTDPPSPQPILVPRESRVSPSSACFLYANSETE